MHILLQLSENSRLRLQKTTGQPKDPWLAARAPHSTTPKYMGRTEEAIQEKPIQKSEKNGRNWKNDGSIQKSEKWEELKERRIKKLCAETDFSIDKIVSCHYTPLETLRVKLAKFKGGNITNCFERANITQDHFFFKYSEVWFNNRICQSTSVSVCITLEFLRCGSWNYWCRNFKTSQ